MQNCLGELNLTYALIYLDDVIVYSKTKEEYLVCLRGVLERFMEHGLKLKPSKCNFFRTEISYLGHKVSAAGMEPGTDGLKGIVEIAPPATYTQVRKFSSKEKIVSLNLTWLGYPQMPWWHSRSLR